jgi:ankyrin repeat protein
MFLVELNRAALAIPDASNGNLPIHVACGGCRSHLLDIAALKLLATAYPDGLDACNRDGKRALHLACARLKRGGSQVIAMIRILIDAYPEALERRDFNESTPIMTAISSGPSGAELSPEALCLLQDMIE